MVCIILLIVFIFLVGLLYQSFVDFKQNQQENSH